ncbi:acyl-CoA thioesterase [Sporothrix curviconia]|uniref:Acyl-CoA thioesterase n=1 Tax=Sporothrix curviconia TaxID=1260050 RepID=A0ABP0BPX9_9PEZI
MPPPEPVPAAGHRRLLTDSMFAVAEDGGPDTFRSTEPLWYPIWARGIYGGALIAQALTAAQHTVSSAFLVHSMHCHFVRAAQADVPLVYHVDRLRDGASLSLRVVRAHQHGQLVFSTTISFARETKTTSLQHQAAFPAAARVIGPPTSLGSMAVDEARLSKTCQVEFGSKFEAVRLPRDAPTSPEKERLLQWMRVRGSDGDGDGGGNGGGDDNSKGGPAGTVQAHLAALAYMTDNYFIGTALRAHRGFRFTDASAAIHSRIQALDISTEKGRNTRKAFEKLAQEEQEENDGHTTAPPVAEMIVSLDHTIFFHEPAAVHADDWLLVEAETPWAGHERGLVIERIWNRNGVLMATCIQEGMVRLKQERGKAPLSKL